MAFKLWKKLLHGIERGQCVLFLGPELPLVTPEGEQRMPVRDLADQLLAELEEDPGEIPGTDSSRLAKIAQRLLIEGDEYDLESAVESWYERHGNLRSTLHDDLAALPFRWIVTSGHDPLIETALREAGKTPCVERYHYLGQNKRIVSELAEPTPEAPVLFYLYGHPSEPSSVVLAEIQVMKFLSRLIAGDPRLPDDLNAALSTSRRFLFLGFGLRQWYLRVLLHVLKVLRRDSRGFAFEAPEEDFGPPDTAAVLFYRKSYQIDIQAADVVEFTKELRSRYVPPQTAPGGAGGGDAPGPPATSQDATAESAARPLPAPESGSSGAKVFICHASEDKPKAALIHDELRRAGLDPWLDSQALSGGDRWDDLIETTIEEADYFVVLNSRALAEKSRSVAYVNKEIKRALQAEDLRLMGTFIIPVTIDETPLLKPLAKFQAVDLTAADGVKSLVRAIKRQLSAA